MIIISLTGLMGCHYGGILLLMFVSKYKRAFYTCEY